MMNAPLDRKVFHIKTPSFPQFRFEWHPEVAKVYVVRLGVEPVIGELICDGVKDQGHAYMTVAVWLRGYRTALLEEKVNVGRSEVFGRAHREDPQQVGTSA